MVTPTGARPIETIGAGDAVLSFDHATSSVVVSRVARAFVHDAQQIYELTVRDEEADHDDRITGTGNHPFYLPDRSHYAALEDLAPGAHLLMPDGRRAIVVSLLRRQGKVEVFNFEIEGEHNYFVSGSTDPPHGVLVHNACPESRKRLFDRLSDPAQRIEPGESTFTARDHRKGSPSRPIEVTRTVAPVGRGERFLDGFPIPEGTTRVTYSDGTHSVNYYLDAHGRTWRVEAPLDPRSDYVKDDNVRRTPYPPGFRPGTDDRGHLAPEAGSPAPYLANVPENLIAENGRASNQRNTNQPFNKYTWEASIIDYARLHSEPNVQFVTVHEVVYDQSSPGNPRPVGARHSVYEITTTTDRAGNQVTTREEIPQFTRYVPNPP